MKLLFYSLIVMVFVTARAEATCIDDDGGAPGPNWTTAGGTEQDIRDCLDSTINTNLADDHSVFIDYSGSINIASQIPVTKAIVIKGRVCTLSTVNNKADIPTACVTVLNGTGSGAIFAITLVADKVTRVKNLKITGTGYGPITLLGQGGTLDPDNRRYVLEFMIFDKSDTGINVWPQYSAWGVVSHVFADLGQGEFFMYPWHGEYEHSDERWAEATTDWGTDRWNYIENSVIKCTACFNGLAPPNDATVTDPLTDGYAASKVAVRFNYLLNMSIQNHGTETGRQRGGKAIQAYKNVMDITNATATPGDTVFARSGSVLTWGQTYTNYAGSAAGHLLAYRTMNGGFGNASGSNPWDVNDGGNPQATFTTASNSTVDQVNLKHTLTVNNVTWTLNQWRGYVLQHVGCIPKSQWQNCSMLVTENTAVTAGTGTITYVFINSGQHLDIASGQQINLNLVTHQMDGPCRAGGSDPPYRNLFAVLGEGFERSGTTVTVGMDAHGLSTGNYIYSHDVGRSPYGNMWQILTGVDCTPDCDADHFQFIMGTPDAWSSSYAYVAGEAVTYMGEIYEAIQNNTNQQPDVQTDDWSVLGSLTFGGISAKPAAFNDQTTEGCYQWLNLNNGGDVTFEPELSSQNLFKGNATGAHFFDYDDDEVFDGTFAANRSSIGVGTKAQMEAITTCAQDTAFWVTDEANWDSVNPGNDGQLYKCGATNNWVLYYTPYTHPHPLAGTADGGGGGGGSGAGVRSGLRTR